MHSAGNRDAGDDIGIHCELCFETHHIFSLQILDYPCIFKMSFEIVHCEMIGVALGLGLM